MTERTPAEIASPGYACTIAYVGAEIAAGRLRIGSIGVDSGIVFEAVLAPKERCAEVASTVAAVVLMVTIFVLPFAVLGLIVAVALRVL